MATLIIHNFSGTNILVWCDSEWDAPWSIPQGKHELTDITPGVIGITNANGFVTIDLTAEPQSLMTVMPATQYEFRIGTSPRYAGHTASYQEFTYWGVIMAFPMIGFAIMRGAFRSGAVAKLD